MKAITHLLTLIRSLVVLFILGVGIAGAQTKEDGINTAPIVPLDTIVRGRQAIADFLTINMDHTILKLGGSSVVAYDERYLDRNSLYDLGYVHRGSFKEFSDAIANIQFNPDVIPTPEGWYDVRVNVTTYTADGRTALQGWGYLNVNTLPDGSLVAGKFEPYVSINSTIAVRLTNNCINAVMWIPENGAQPEQLPIYGDSEGYLTIMQYRMLENGVLAVADCSSEVVSWNLRTGKETDGKHVFALLGKTRSGAILPLMSPEKLAIDLANQVWFYKFNGAIYGEMPLLEQAFDTAVSDYFTLEVPIWNSVEKAHPTQAFVTPIIIYGDAGGLELYKEYPVLVTDGGQIGLKLPAGTYHIRTVFKGLRSWDNLGGKG